MGAAVSNTIMGVSIVFFVLVSLSFLIYLFRFISVIEDKLTISCFTQTFQCFRQFHVFKVQAHHPILCHTGCDTREKTQGKHELYQKHFHNSPTNVPVNGTLLTQKYCHK